MKRFGAEAYRAQLDAASSYFHWLADRARAKFDMRGADGRMDAFKFLLPAVQKISDKLERAAVASDLAGYLGVDQVWCWSSLSGLLRTGTPGRWPRDMVPPARRIRRAGPVPSNGSC